MMKRKKSKRPHPYAKFTSAELILRDQLAVDRTLLANERTVLAYARTIVGFVIAGFSLLDLFPDSRSLFATAIGCLALALIIGVVGVVRFMEKLKHLSQLRKIEDIDVGAELLGEAD